MRSWDANMKMAPPLRTKRDIEALVEALVDGTIDCIATDHAPHAAYEKEREFDQAPFGILGLETSFSSTYTHLVKPGILTLNDAIAKMSTIPAKILGLPGGTLAIGAVADVSVFDLDKIWTVQPSVLHSKSRNTPFMGWELQGKAVFTVLGGRVVEV